MTSTAHGSEPSVNEIRLLGRIMTDVEYGRTDGDSAYLTFQMVTTEITKEDAGEPRKLTEWHHVTTYGRAADSLRPQLQKGTRVLVIGSNRTRHVSTGDRLTPFTEVKAIRIIPVADAKNPSSPVCSPDTAAG